MGWFRRKLNTWATGKHQEELKTFLDMLKMMDSNEIGFVVACATHVRHILEAEGHNMMDPIVYVAQNPGFPFAITSSIQAYQKQENPHMAAALMVWAHTLRGAVRLEVRGLARHMWRELERGFPYVESAAGSFGLVSGTRLNISDAQSFPKGFTPNPM